MATDIAPEAAGVPPAKRKRSAEKVVGYDRFIEDHLRKTRSQVKWVEISSAAMILVAGTLAYLLVVVLLDHWLIPGGLGFWGRFAALVLLALGAGGYFVVGLAPLLLRRVNPVYAAHAIEQARPTLKNSLVNFLLLRSSREGVSEPVYQAVEQQAATRLSQVHVDSAVDRTKLIKIFAVLTGIVAVSCLYLVISPKNPLSTVRRVVLPWADIAVPTRVTIEEVSPGDTSTFYDGYVTVEAVVRGVDDADPVTLFYSTADGQSVDQPIAMQRPADAYRHSATLPAGTGGLQQDVTYYISAGDARSNLYQVEVRPAPTIVVDRVEYHYPQYTGMEPATRQHGDLKAIEGTRVTLHAKANQDILAAWLDLDCQGKRNKSFKHDGREATIRIPLRLTGEGGSPEFSSFQIRFTNLERHENPQPIRHTVDVVPDQPPDVKFDAPTQPETELAANDRLEIQVRARDPDFALSRVEILGERVDQSGNVLLSEPLLKEEQTEFEGSFTFDPAKLKLKPGDTVRVWAQARDNRRPNDDQPPQPNISETDKFKIVIVEPELNQPRENELAKNDPQPAKQPPEEQPRDQQQQKDQQQKGEQQKGQGQQGEKGDGAGQQGEKGNEAGQQGDQKQNQPNQGNQNNKQQGGQNGQQNKADGQQGDSKQSDQQGEKGGSGSERRVDPMSNPGDAFDEALKHRQQQEQQQNGGASKPQPGEKNSQPEEQAKQDGASGDQQQPKPDGSPEAGKRPQEGSSDGSKQPQQGNKPGETPEAGRGAKQQPGQNEQAPMPGDQNDARQESGAENNPRGKQNDAKQDADGQQDGGQQGPNSDKSPPNGQGQGAGAKQPGDEKSQPGKQNDPTRSEKEPMPGSGQSKQGEQAKSGDESTPESAEGTRQAEGQGAEQKGSFKPDQKSPSEPGQTPDTKGGDRDNEKGNQGGAGQKTDENKPSPSPQETNQPRGEKEPSADEQSGKPPMGDEAKSPSQSKKQSDSKGGEAGDQSGGGKPGSGQAASGKEGTGAPGSSTASDQGNKKAPGSGQGETSDQAGEKVGSDKPTGQSDPNERRGEGAEQKPGEGDQAGGQPGAKQPQGKQSPNGKQPENQGNRDGENRDGGEQGSSKDSDKPQGRKEASDRGNSTGGGGQPGNAQGQPTAGDQDGEGNQPGELGDQTQKQLDKPDEPAGDPANLDYARQATDLALEHLKDQLKQDQPDQDLLDKLKWSREDLQRFVDHWEKMKRDAQAPGEAGDAARRKLDESLKGLGLKPQGTRIKSNTGGGDKLQELRSSRRASPPSEIAEQFKAYKQRLAKGQDEEK